MIAGVTRGSAITTTLLAAFLLTSCGEFAGTPTAPVGEVDRTVLSQTAPEGMSGMIVFTPKALAAAKLAQVDGGDVLWAIDSGWFAEAAGGKLEVVFPGNALGQALAAGNSIVAEEAAEVDQAEFTFYAGSIGVDGDLDRSGQPQPVMGGYEIGMAVSSGQTLDDICVVFGPSGLTFSPAAAIELKVTASPSVLQEGTIVGYHISHGGTVITPIKIFVTQLDDNLFKLVTDVPGFSRYDYGDGSTSHDNEGCGPWPLMPCGW